MKTNTKVNELFKARAATKISFVILGLLIASGCKPGAGTDNAALGDSSLSSLSVCGNVGTPLADSAILGAQQIISGQSSLLKLDASVNCAEAQKATWSASGVVLGYGPQVSAKINGTGVYLIAVDSESQFSGTTISSISKMGTSNKLFTTAKVTTSTLVGVTNTALLLVGPQVGIEFNSYDFSLAIPQGIQLLSAEWSFGDGTAIVNSLAPVSHSFAVGSYVVSVRTVDINNQVINLSQSISILPLTSGIDCPVNNLSIVGATVVPAETTANFSLSEASCIAYAGTQITWNFGDGTPSATTSSVSHTYTIPGDYILTAVVRLGADDRNTITLTRQITVLSFLEVLPGPVPTTDPVPTPVPAPAPTPAPVTIDPNACLDLGATRVISGDIKSRSEVCGLNGIKENKFRDQITQVCKLTNEVQIWSEQSRTEVLVSEGICLQQSCTLQTTTGSQVLTDNQSIVTYSSANPIGTCASVQQTRLCTNGVLSGSVDSKFLTCENGCADFGPNNTVQIGVVTGEISTPVTCSFGETGIVNIINQISDKKCVSGQVITSNTRSGEIKSAGVCPVYNWVASSVPVINGAASEVYSACSADCGGIQTKVFECRDAQGVLTSNDRCILPQPIETRVCDGNPDAVKSTTSTTNEEEIGSSAICPKHQIGVITQERTTTITISFACINHKISEASRETVSTPYVTNTYCRDLVTARCSHDSLSNEKAAGRHQWMVKCEKEVPLIKEFLENFEDTKYKKIGLNNTTRHLYPTFMDSKKGKTWIAPTTEKASCSIPATAYIAAVCVSSCATPEQTIIAKAKHDKNLKVVSFIEALTQNMAWVGTLQSNSIMSSKDIQKTAVDKWVTELVDTKQPILIFKLKSGGELKLTLNHALLHETGIMKMASEFKVGDNLLQLGAKKDQIIAIEHEDYFGKVYNVFVKSNDLKKNVVVLNGYLAGTAYFQNEGTKDLNRLIFQKHLIRGVLEK